MCLKSINRKRKPTLVYFDDALHIKRLILGCEILVEDTSKDKQGSDMI